MYQNVVDYKNVAQWKTKNFITKLFNSNFNANAAAKAFAANTKDSKTAKTEKKKIFTRNSIKNSTNSGEKLSDSSSSAAEPKIIPNMQKTDCGSSGNGSGSSSALQQETNLARRACWSNKSKRKTSIKNNCTITQSCKNQQQEEEEDDGLEYFDEYFPATTTTSSPSSRTMSMEQKMSKDGANFSENFNKSNKSETYDADVDIDDDDDVTDPKLKHLINNLSKKQIELEKTNSKSVNNLIKSETKTKTQIKVPNNIVNNNKNDKNITKVKSNNKNNNNNNKNNLNEYAKINYDNKAFAYDINKQANQATDDNIVILNSNVITCNSNSHDVDDDGNVGETEMIDVAVVDANPCYDFRSQVLSFWLTFVAFCDSITIKHDDPRFDAARRRDQEASNNKNNESTTTIPSKFKLITSKKFIFLFIVCILCSFLNRIDARPNTSAFNNLLTDSSNAIGGLQNDGAVTEHLPEIAKLTLAASPTESSINALPPTPNVISKQHVAEELPQSDQGRAVLVLSGHDDAEPHHQERYPVSQTDFGRVKTPFIISIWILSASIAKIGFHMTPKLNLIFPESCLLIVVGVAIGVVLYFGTDVAVSPLTPNTFFFYMLPPIILDAGYFMPNRLFFDNLGTILLMAVIGTIFNIATIGGALYACGIGGVFGDETPKFLDIFLFASLISAVDPVAVLAVFEEIHVNEILYIVVFGESLLNDAVTVVMYHMMEVYNEIGISNIIAQDIASGVGSFFVVALGGTVIGIIWGFLTGLVTRFTDHVRVIEPIFIFVMAYLAYLNAEIFHMSGILAITFCGITMKNYVESNISQKSHTTVKYALKMLSSSSETIIFMFLGVATVNNSHVWNTSFVVLTIVFCSVFRVIGVILLTAIANRFRLHKLSRVDQFVMSYGGLRGAVAFALVLLVDERVVKQKNMYVTTTIAVIYFTVFIQGITIKPLVKFLNVKRANKRKPTMNERIHERFMDHLMAGIEDIVGKTGNYNVRDKFKRFDNRFIRPLLIRDLKGAEPKIIETYSKLTMRDAMEVMRRNPSTIGQISGTESMSALFRNYTNNCIGGSPSLTNLDTTCSRNLDMHELDYNPSKKDLTDAKIHHLLAEELKPYRRHRRLSYSRHAVDDRDLSTQVNYKMQMNFRRMFNDRKHHKRSKRGGSKQPETNTKQNHVSFHDFQQNGSTKQFTHDDNPAKSSDVNVAGVSDDWDDGLTFTAKSSPDSDRANNNSLIAHIQNLPGFDASKARIVQHYSAPNNKDAENDTEEALTPEFAPTAAELILPWRRDRSYPNFVAENPIPEEDRNTHARDSDSEQRVSTPTAMESQLPWKRHNDEVQAAVQQNEFPAWASNKEYLAYNSPSATFLGGINKPKQPKSVIGLFRRESSGSKGGGSISEASAGSDPALAAALASSFIVPSSITTHNPRLDKRSLSISAGSGVSSDSGHSGPFAVTASHRRNVRRGSMLELTGDTIPEETHATHGHSKSLCEPGEDDDDNEWNIKIGRNGGGMGAGGAGGMQHERTNSGSSNERFLRNGREPLLPRLTPRAQIKRGMSTPGVGRNQVTSALLSTSNSDYDYDDDDEEEDFDSYDDENIVVTTTTTPGVVGRNRSGSNSSQSGNNSSGGAGGAAGAGGSGGPSTITTIRLTRNNDESII